MGETTVRTSLLIAGLIVLVYLVLRVGPGEILCAAVVHRGVGLRRGALVRHSPFAIARWQLAAGEGDA